MKYLSKNKLELVISIFKVVSKMKGTTLKEKNAIRKAKLFMKKYEI